MIIHPKLYCKNMEWQPNPATPEIENAINRFVIKTYKTVKAKRQFNHSNLTMTQRNLMRTLKNHKKFMVIAADKGLGPCVIEREAMMRIAMTQHLSKKCTYKIITEADVKRITHNAVCKFTELCKKSKHVNKHELLHIKRKLLLAKRTS